MSSMCTVMKMFLDFHFVVYKFRYKPWHSCFNLFSYHNIVNEAIEATDQNQNKRNAVYTIFLWVI